MLTVDPCPYCNEWQLPCEDIISEKFNICRFVRIQGKLQKAVSSLEFFTSKGWSFSNDNMYMLDKVLSPEDRKVG